MKYPLLLFYFLFSFHLMGQHNAYEVELEAFSIPELGGLQSYSIGSYQGEWLIVGGRLDGLHQRQPFAAFDQNGNNSMIIVVNPETKISWKASISTLPASIREQLASTNMQFYQDENHLILTGGYAYSPSSGDHITFPYLTIIDLPLLIDEVKNSSVSDASFSQYEDPLFQVCGGRLNKLGDTYFLVGGHKFMGRYNPMGPTHGPGFIQEYTNEIRKFKLHQDSEVVIESLPSIHDERHFHRRDYNLMPFVENNEKQLMIYSGVFQKNADLPYLYPVQISEDTYQAIESFSQYFNHYHCASLPIYNPNRKDMNTLFFGGIAQFYKEGDLMVQDNDVPFVNTISDVYRSSDGSLFESTLSTTMPGYLGAGSEFIPLSKDLDYIDGVINGDLITNDFTPVGYIYGGIRSTLPNIFWQNTGAESNATNVIYKVNLRKKISSSQEFVQEDKSDILFYPNPAQDFIRLSLSMKSSKPITVEVYSMDGKLVDKHLFEKNEIKAGRNYLVLENSKVEYGAYLYRVRYDNQSITRKVIWTE